MEPVDDPPAVAVSSKPKLFSKQWGLTVMSAFNFKNYDARDWGIYNLSSLCTYGTVFGIFKPVMTFVVSVSIAVFKVVTHH